MNPKILIIDDEESIRFTFKKFLSEEGYEVITAGDYNGALSNIKETEFDLIFVDIILGAKTGIDIVRNIKERNLKSYVILITGDPNVESAAEAVRLGAFDYIPKPIRQDTLLRAARLALKHKALDDERERFRSNLEAIFRSVKDAIITVDRGLFVIEANDAVGNVCGFSREDVGKAFSSLTQRCNGSCREIIDETIKRQQPAEVLSFECRHIDRQRQVVSITASPLMDIKGNFSGAVVVIRDETKLSELERNLRERKQFHNIIGKSKEMQKLYSLIEDLADTDTTVLITGESGTGKELVAEALHYSGERRQKPLVKVSCSTLSEPLLESELFGHVRGAFTGAFKDRIGRFQTADGGTIFLDEIGDISQGTQMRLLRVLQEREFERVGDSKPIKVDVRVIAATNQNLAERLNRGEFRNDLYYRLNVVELKLPPLRGRREDIPLLVDYFIGRFNKKMNKDIATVSEDVQRLFMDYRWLGNVRELEHALEHAFILCRQNTITLDDLPADLRDFTGSRRSSIKQYDLKTISQALEKTGGNKAKAARMLGINRRTLYRKLPKG